MDYAALIANEKLEEIVPVPEWGGEIRLVKMDPSERFGLISFADKLSTNDDGTPATDDAMLAMGVEVLALTIRDDVGKQPFNNKKGRLFLSRADLVLLNRISQLAIDLNGLRPAETNGAVKTTKKNLNDGISTD